MTVIHRRDTLRASKVMQDKAMSMPTSRFIWNTEVIDIKDLAQGMVTGLVLRNLITGETERSAGRRRLHRHRPRAEHANSSPASSISTTNGYIVTHDGTRTSVPGVFAAGDVQDHIYRQAVTAAGSGCMAAIDAERFLSGVAHEAPAATATQSFAVTALTCLRARRSAREARSAHVQHEALDGRT